MDTEITYDQWLAELESFAADTPTDALTTSEWSKQWNVPKSRAVKMVKQAVLSNFMKAHRIPCTRMDGIKTFTSGYALSPPEGTSND